MQFMYGTDPEGFIVNRKTGQFVAAAGIIPGTKALPFKVEKGAVQVDGLAAEFNIDPVDNADDFNKNIQIVINQLIEMIHEVDKDLELTFVPTAHFDTDYFVNLNPEIKILGCDPDFNIRGEVNEIAGDLSETPIRTAAGHLHIGWRKEGIVEDPTHFEDCRMVAESFHKKGLKFFKPETPAEKVRLHYYGHSGAFRPKTYGVELRSPSNLWVKTKESRIEMFNIVNAHMKELVG